MVGQRQHQQHDRTRRRDGRYPGAVCWPGPAMHPTVPEKEDQAGHRQRRGSAGRRPYAFDPGIYKNRTVVERGFNRFKHWRGLASRFDKTAVCYLGGLTLAALLLWTEP